MNAAWEANHMSLLQALQEATTTVTERVAPAVVRIGRGGGRGAGVVVADGLVVTNAHNLRGSQVTVTFADGRSETGDVAGAAADGDPAVIRVPTPQAAPPAWCTHPAP